MLRNKRCAYVDDPYRALCLAVIERAAKITAAREALA